MYSVLPAGNGGLPLGLASTEWSGLSVVRVSQHCFDNVPGLGCLEGVALCEARGDDQRLPKNPSSAPLPGGSIQLEPLAKDFSRVGAEYGPAYREIACRIADAEVPKVNYSA
jgi:hypothetical protein